MKSYLNIDYTISNLPLLDPKNPDDYITEYEGKVYETTNTFYKLIGRVTCSRVNLPESKTYFDIMLCHGQEMLNYYNALFINNQSKVLLKSYTDLLIIKTVEVIPEYRKQNLGHKIVNNVIRVIGGGCTAALIRPYPMGLQYIEPEEDKNDPLFKEMKYHEFEKNKNKAIKSLTEYWEKFGFEPIPETPNYLYYNIGFKSSRVY